MERVPFAHSGAKIHVFASHGFRFARGGLRFTRGYNPAPLPGRTAAHMHQSHGRTSAMRCEQGYLCDVCGEDVAEITESSLYLRYVIGEIPARDLMSHPERHLKCDPYLAQFIVDDNFPPVTMDGPFARAHLEPAEAARLTELTTRGWRRLQDVRALGLPISQYPL